MFTKIGGQQINIASPYCQRISSIFDSYLVVAKSYSYQNSKNEIRTPIPYRYFIVFFILAINVASFWCLNSDEARVTRVVHHGISAIISP